MSKGLIIPEHLKENPIKGPPNLTVVPGGKGPGKNWLGELDIGTIFLSRPRDSKSVILECSELIWKTEDTNYGLIHNKTTDLKVYVDTLGFSIAMEPIRIIGNILRDT